MDKRPAGSAPWPARALCSAACPTVARAATEISARNQGEVNRWILVGASEGRRRERGESGPHPGRSALESQSGGIGDKIVLRSIGFAVAR